MRNDAGGAESNRAALAQLGARTAAEERSGASLSGHERDHLFLSDRGAEFTDVGGVSGLDDPADGRAAAFLDYDRDGFIDIALTNANAPRLELFRNRIGCLQAAAGTAPGAFVALRFVGGNTAPRPSAGWSARDGYGARVSVDLGDRTLVREHRAGEGFAAQNSATMLAGIGTAATARGITVRWPSGKVQAAADVAAGTLLTVYEDPSRSPTGEAFVRAPYVVPAAAAGANVPAAPSSAATRAAGRAPVPRRPPLPFGPDDGPPPRLRLYTTMATWCVNCVGELPHLRRLRALFSPADLAMNGVPVDPDDSREKIEAWGAANRPPYTLHAEMTRAQMLNVKSLVRDRLNGDAVPATFITDGAGNLLHAQWGPPTLSRIRALLADLPRDTGAAGTTAGASGASGAAPSCAD